MATRKKKVVEKEVRTYPYDVVGTHLTVTYYEDGRTSLKWDDEQLLKEVQEAIASAQQTKKRGK